MLSSRKNLISFRSALTNKYLLHNRKYKSRKVDTVAKRGEILNKLFTDKDKRKNWHLNLIVDKPKVRLFDKIHMPHRRHRVLNSLFVKNITDVLSTGDITPELSKYQIDITGVQISQCYNILNVFWQIPSSQYDSCEDIAKLLTIAAPKIRAELISRNVLGRVPFIFFLRDSTNSRVADFEKAMEKLNLEPPSDSPFVVDDSFVNDLYSFKPPKVKKGKEDKEDHSDSDIESDVVEESKTLPQNPLDMKSNTFGLDQELMMEKVIALKKKKKSPPTKTALISIESLKDEDIFDKIPGVRFEPGNSTSSRDEILKQFFIERKKLKQSIKVNVNNDSHEYYNSEEYDDDDDDGSENSYDAEPDFFEEDILNKNITENSRH